MVEVTNEAGPIPVDGSSVKKGDKTMAGLLAELAENLRKQVSQWVYVQRGLRLFDGPRIHLYKSPRIIDWTRTQARINAGDIIEELIQNNDQQLTNANPPAWKNERVSLVSRHSPDGVRPNARRAVKNFDQNFYKSLARETSAGPPEAI